MEFDFVAVDFETANANYSSACSIGLVAVKDNSIVQTEYFLIHPPTLDFDEDNIKINGITPEKVKDELFFPEVWDKIKGYFHENTIIAHNAVFDMSVLKSCLLEYNLEVPDFNYLCSIPISTRACRGEKVGRSLQERANYFNIDLGEHHNALSDAATCAKLVIKCIQIKKRKNLESFCKVHSSLPIKNFTDLIPQTTFKKPRHNKFERIVTSEIAATTEDFDQSGIFYGKNVVFTGELEHFDRRTAMQNIVDLGGNIKNSVSSKTDYLVVGTQDKSLVGEDGMSTKEEKAYQLINKGSNIKVINENEFLKLLNS